jgi:hypothetical protein
MFRGISLPGGESFFATAVEPFRSSTPLSSCKQFRTPVLPGHPDEPVIAGNLVPRQPAWSVLAYVHESGSKEYLAED